MESKYYKVTDVMALLECSRSFAYKVIREANKELKAKGYVVMDGRIPKSYLDKRLGLE